MKEAALRRLIPCRRASAPASSDVDKMSAAAGETGHRFIVVVRCSHKAVLYLLIG
jgi:hypothetical protein